MEEDSKDENWEHRAWKDTGGALSEDRSHSKVLNRESHDRTSFLNLFLK